MKTKLLLLYFIIGLFFNACQQHEGMVPAKGNITFSLSKKSRNDGRISGAATPVFVLLSIEDDNGKLIFENKKISLFSFGQGYVSESVELNTGRYRLTQFMVLDTSEKIIYATPVEGSDLAKYISHPLPIEFAITKEESTQIVPQVLDITSADSPENFGYASFGFEVVKDKVRFELYTNQDFSNEEGSIIFEAKIYKTGPGNPVLWDSVFAPMAIKNIPNVSNKIVFDKVKPGNNGAELYAGFKYTIVGVGYSWYYVKIGAEEKYKTISFDFK